MTRVKMKNGKTCEIREIVEKDCMELIDHVNSLASEEIYVACEGLDIDADEERAFIRVMREGGKRMIYLALVDNLLAGHVDIQIGPLAMTSHVAEIGMGVKKRYRGMGLGKLLLSEAEKWAKEKEVQKVKLEVFSSNDRALGLYQKFGYRIEASLKNEYIIDGKFVDAIWMSKFI